MGKSSVAAYLSVSLAKRGHKVGLMDVDLHMGPSIPRMLGLMGMPQPSDHPGKAVPISYLPNMQVISFEPLLGENKDVATNLALSVKSQVQLLDCDVEEPNAHLFIHPVFEKNEAITTPVPQVDENKCTVCGNCAEICEFKAIVVMGEVLVEVMPEWKEKFLELYDRIQEQVSNRQEHPS